MNEEIRLKEKNGSGKNSNLRIEENYPHNFDSENIQVIKKEAYLDQNKHRNENLEFNNNQNLLQFKENELNSDIKIARDNIKFKTLRCNSKIEKIKFSDRHIKK